MKRNHQHLLLLALTFLIASCANQESKETTSDNMNPFFNPYQTPFEVPPFHLINNSHFKPALEEGMRLHSAEIEALVAEKAVPTYENTIEALEKSGSFLSKVSTVFSNLNGANTNDSLQAIAREMASSLSAHSDNITLNPALFSKVSMIWEQKDQLGLTDEQLKLLDRTYKSFVRNGANLSETDKAKLRDINQKLSTLSIKFGQNILAETNSFKLIIDKESDLAGLPEALIETAKADAAKANLEGKWLFTLQNPSVMPFLQYAENRELRKQIFEAYKMRGDNGNEQDNNDLAKQIANLRREKAQLLGYKSHADFVLENSMAKTPENVYKLLDQLWSPALAKAKQEAADIQAMIKQEGGKFNVEPYDWRYYTEKIRKARFDLDEQELKPYFSLDKVTEGVFTVTNKLYGITFTAIQDIPKYHEDVVAYEVKEADGSHIGVLYMDFHPRASKRGGAWMTSYRPQGMVDGKRKAPIISIVCNFSKPTENKPALLTFDEVSTYFHEFGHALHGLLSDVQYKSLAGTSVPRDFVELPSQIMENWAAEPEVMKMFAKHFETGETIPDALIEKIKKAGTFDQGFATTEYLAASLLDLDFHTQTDSISGSIRDFEKKSMEKIGLIDQIIPRYRSTYFNHIFSGGYSAGYYSYIWSGVLDTDAFEAFKETSLFNPELAKSFREKILERGGTREPMDMYVDFRGREPEIGPLLRKRGLDQTTQANTEVKR